MGHDLCGLTARLWRSCGSARKTSRIARSCSPLSQMPHKPIPADSVHCGTTQRRPNWSARSRRKGCTRPSRSIAAASVRSTGRRRAACCSRSRPMRQASPVDKPKETPGNAIKLPPWCESRRAEIVAAQPPLCRSPARQRVAGRWSRKILFCASGARFIPSPRASSRSNYVCARGRGGHEAFIGCGYRREYWR